MTSGRRRGASTSAEVSLFPFLAVLLCTMGMLIMLLVLIGQNTAPRQEAEAVRPEPPEAVEPLGDLFADAPGAESAPKPEPPDKPRDDKTEENRPEPIPEKAAETTADKITEKIAENPPAAVPPVSPSPDDSPAPAVEPKKKTAREIQYEALRERFGGADLAAIENELKTADWFKGELEGVRSRTADSLRQRREELAATEARIAEQVNHLVELNAQVLTLKGENDPDAPNVKALTEEIERKAAEIARLTAEVERLKAKVSENADKKSYAIVPYKGKSGTFRRPIYVECYAGGIALMPENVPFTAEDFLLAKYPGNPFDAAMRSARQYYIETGEGDAENEPYPLLIVRPGGASQYYAAREALASWGGDCGYEFVEDGAAIDYPAADSELARRVEEQVILARSRLAVPLATMIAEMRQNGSAAGGLGDGGSGNGGLGGSVGSGGSSGSGGGSSTSSGGLAEQLGPYAKLTPVDESGVGAGDSTRLPNYRGTFGSNPSGGSAGGVSSGGYAAGNAPGYLPASPQSGYAGRSTGQASQNAVTAGAASVTPENPTGSAAAHSAKVNSTTSATASSSVNAAADSANNQAAVASATEPSLFASTAANPQSAASSAQIDPRQTLGNTAFERTDSTAGEPGTPDGTAVRPEPTKPEKEPTKPKVESEPIPGAINLNDELRKKTNVAMERPIRIECRPDRIVFPAQAGIPGGSEVLLNEKTDAEILRTIVACVNAWNVAGRNRYWSPWIQARAVAGGEASFERLERLMRSQRVRIDRVE